MNYDFDSAVEAAENIVSLSEDYEGIEDASVVAAGLQDALSIYQQESYGGALSMLQDSSPDYDGDVTYAVKLADTTLDQVEEAQREECKKQGLGEEDKALMLAREHLVHRPAEEFDAKSALEG